MYKDKIKALQLDGTLNKIREEIDVHHDKEFDKRRENPDYEIQYMHFNDRLVEILGADDPEEINLTYYQLITEDKEFAASYQEYKDEKERLKKIEDEEYIASLKESWEKAPPERKKELLDILNKHKDIFE